MSPILPFPPPKLPPILLTSTYFSGICFHICSRVSRAERMNGGGARMWRRAELIQQSRAENMQQSSEEQLQQSSSVELCSCHTRP